MTEKNFRLKSGVFDAVICMGVVHHLGNKENELKEMCRVVKKNGYIFIAESQKSNSVIFLLHDKILSIPRFFKMMFLRLSSLETEHPLTNFDLDLIEKVAKECRKSVKVRQYLYLPHFFRFLSECFQKIFFRLLNLHVKFDRNFDIVAYNNPKKKLNIVEVIISD